MAYEQLSTRERIHIERAHSQALYYAQRGFADACRIYAPHIPAVQRSLLSGIVGSFLVQYVTEELAHVVYSRHDCAPMLDAPIRDTAPAIFDPFGEGEKPLTARQPSVDTYTPKPTTERISL